MIKNNDCELNFITSITGHEGTLPSQGAYELEALNYAL